MVGGGLFQSPPVTKKSPTPTEKSPTPTEKSPTVISKRRWTLEYSGGLEFSSPFMEQWTLDARGVLKAPVVVVVTNISDPPIFSVWYDMKTETGDLAL